jgi:hypothetical protein
MCYWLWALFQITKPNINHSDLINAAIHHILMAITVAVQSNA